MQGVVRALAAAGGLVLLVLVGFPVALGPLAEAPGESAPVYVYAGHHHNSAPTSVTVERGPPSTTYADIAHTADGPGPRDASARPDTVAGSAHTTYGELTRSAQVTVVRTTTTAAAVPASGISALAEPARVAAETAADAGSASNRVLQRMAEESGPYHNFPTSFDDEIFSNGTKTTVRDFFNKAKPNLSNDSIQYRLPGELNGRSGTYEMFTRPSLSGRTEMIMHRFFRPDY